jgi:hypothetical protein
MTGYTTTGNVNTDQQFSGPMPWETGSQPPILATPMPAMEDLPAQNLDAMILKESGSGPGFGGSARPTGGVTPLPAGFNPASAPQTYNINQPPPTPSPAMPPAPQAASPAVMNQAPMAAMCGPMPMGGGFGPPMGGGFAPTMGGFGGRGAGKGRTSTMRPMGGANGGFNPFMSFM